jgi:hypothetical protein
MPRPERSDTVAKTDYRVCWEIDIVAEEPADAARQALAIQRDSRSTSTVFDVHDGDKSVRVDLEADTQYEI